MPLVKFVFEVVPQQRLISSSMEFKPEDLRMFQIGEDEVVVGSKTYLKQKGGRLRRVRGDEARRYFPNLVSGEITIREVVYFYP